MFKLLKIFFCRHDYTLERVIPNRNGTTEIGLFRCENCGKKIKDQF